MDIDSFIQHYRPEWDRLEQACARGGRGLAKRTGPEIDDLVRLYLRTSAHLAEVRTRYRDPRLEAYLNRVRSEEHTSELQSQSNLVCRLLLEKKKEPSS